MPQYAALAARYDGNDNSAMSAAMPRVLSVADFKALISSGDNTARQENGANNAPKEEEAENEPKAKRARGSENTTANDEHGTTEATTVVEGSARESSSSSPPLWASNYVPVESRLPANAMLFVSAVSMCVCMNALFLHTGN